MSKPDARLQKMIARLAGMDASDRAYVLDRLGADARDRLTPLLGGATDPASLSPGLQALVQAVMRGARPQTMTAKAIAAVQSVQKGAR
jgi:hypothetical protein